MHLELLAASLLVLAAAPSAPAPGDLEDIVAEIDRDREEADPALLDEIAAFKSREAAEQLIALYDRQGSLYMRMEILKRLSVFDSVGEANQMALQKLADVATGSPDLELREIALDTLDECPELGKNFLELIVTSPAEDDVRERALDLHISKKSEGDSKWYHQIYETELGLAEVDKKSKRKKKKKDDEEPEEVVYRLPTLAHKAFEAMAPDLDDDDLVEALEGDHGAIHVIALDEYVKRSPKKAQKYAEDFYDHPETGLKLRIRSAQILSEGSFKKMSKTFVSDAGKFATPDGLRMALGDILAEHNEGSINKKLARGLDKGKAYEVRFKLRAIVNYEDEELNEEVRELLQHEDVGVRFGAARFLVQRGDAESIGDLEQMMAKLEDPVRISKMLDLMSQLGGDSSAWEEQLLEYAKSTHVEVRNAALYQIGKDGRGEHFELLVEGLKNPDWSTRLASLRGLELIREARVVGPIVERMQEETGRIKIEFANVLFNLTGQPFRGAEKSWLAWWRDNADGFEVISLAELEKAREAEELRRLKQVTNSKFFGVRIVSERVIFIIDVSGSMEEKMVTPYQGETKLTRMDVARRELINAIKSMARGALFNIIIFSSGVEPWLEDGVAGANSVERDEAEAYVARLKPGGGTNLYDSLKMAFRDADVDTIFILSDGEPTMGEVTDINRIRKNVADWNEHRGIVIHTIGIGQKLKVLEWLSEDSGGKHVKLR